MNYWESIFRKTTERPTHAYLVGEEGPEIFLPFVPGQIVPIPSREGDLWEQKRQSWEYGSKAQGAGLPPLISMAEGGPVEPVSNPTPGDAMGELLDLFVLSQEAIKKNLINPEIGQFLIQKLAAIFRIMQQGKAEGLASKTIPLLRRE